MLEVPNASPTRDAAAKHKSQQLSSRVSCLLVCFLKRLALPYNNMEGPSRTMHLTSGIIAHFTECSEHICTNFWGCTEIGIDEDEAVAQPQLHPHQYQFLSGEHEKS